MELPFHLKTMQPLPGALDIIRFLGSIDSDSADVDEILDSVDVSEKGFNKAIRRLVTKGYVTMTGDMVYQLTDQGESAVMELAEYDAATGGGLKTNPDRPQSPTSSTIVRRMVLTVPEALVAGQQASAVIGFYPGPMRDQAELAVRLSVVNGEPQSPEDLLFTLTDEVAYQAIEIKAGTYDQIRIRLQAIQLGPNPGDFNQSGGMYVDLPVQAQDSGHSSLVAYGTDINITV